jgi:hypothetical protein
MLIAALGPPLFLVGRTFWRRIEASNIWDWLQQVVITGMLQAFGVIIVLIFFVLQLLQGLYLGVQVARGHYEAIEGTVEAFTPGDPGDHQEETWTVTVDGVPHTYSYSPSRLTPGFRLTAGNGGPIHAGLQVRLAEVAGHIARLEVAP